MTATTAPQPRTDAEPGASAAAARRGRPRARHARDGRRHVAAVRRRLATSCPSPPTPSPPTSSPPPSAAGASAPSPSALDLPGRRPSLALTWGHLGRRTTLGLPTGRHALRGRADPRARRGGPSATSGRRRRCSPASCSSAGAALWVGAWLADLAAFRLWTPFEALIPVGTLFVFASLFSAERTPGAGRRAVARAGAWLRARCTAPPASRPARRGSAATPASARALVAAGGCRPRRRRRRRSAGVIGPRLPGADADPIVAVRDLGRRRRLTHRR